MAHLKKYVGKTVNHPPDPSDEYVIGVLEPKDTKRSEIAHFGSAGLFGNQQVNLMDEPELNPDEEDDADSSTSSAMTEISPELDPRALPKSLGISFVLDKRDATISICVTWARYKQEKKCWLRNPFSFIVKNVPILTDTSWNSDKDSGVEIVLKQVELEQGIHVSIFFLNVTSSTGEYSKVEELIFQPQIRVVCDEGSKVLPIGCISDSTEFEDFNLLYKHRYAKARGHLCGAVWDEIDPESSEISPEEKSTPFAWIDGALLDAEDRKIFEKPHVRTDYLPCYSVEQSVLSGPVENRLEPISADSLSECYDFKDLADKINPLVHAYENWITKQSNNIIGLRNEEKVVALKNLDLCKKSLNRIKEGLDTLNSDSEARLAFCFMNKIMHQQSIWKNPRKPQPLKWHLFQISFILQNITGLVKENHPDRHVCDLLWFPTGAGKTEAYLGLASFEIALRRRKAIKSGKPEFDGGVTVLSRYTLRLLTIQQFRRALNMITACEYYRTLSWVPNQFKSESSEVENFWGTTKISIGLWVGAGVTPNHLLDWAGRDKVTHQEKLYLGAIGELYGRYRLKTSISAHIEGEESEPAQVLKCPACNNILALSSTTLTKGANTIHWLVTAKKITSEPDVSLIRPYRGLSVKEIKVKPLPTIVVN